MSLAAGRTQRSYYHSARERKRTLEERLGLGDLTIDATPGMGGGRRRFGKVHQVHAAVIGVILLLDIAGVVVATRIAVSG